MNPEDMGAADIRKLSEDLLAKFQASGFDYRLNPQGKIARLDDARDLAKTLANAVSSFINSSEPLLLLAMMTGDTALSEGLAHLTSLALVTHLVCCTDPKCKINNPS